MTLVNGSEVGYPQWIQTSARKAVLMVADKVAGFDLDVFMAVFIPCKSVR